MKHPALARVFSIVLAIMSVLMMLNGALGFRKADAAFEESERTYSRLEEKTDIYALLSAQMKNSVSYEEALAELETLQEQHDEDAAQHRTDLATHTATMGGYELGANMIREGQEQLAQAKAELESGKALLAENEKKLKLLRTAFDALEPVLRQAIANSNGSDTEYKLALAIIDRMIAEIDEALKGEPQAPEVPEQPAAPEEPVPLAADADEAAQAAYDQAMLAYNAKTVEYNRAMEAYDAAMADYAQEFQGYQTALASWQQHCQNIMITTEANAAEAESRIQAGNALRDAVLESLPADILEGLGGLVGSDIEIPDLSDMTLEEQRALLVQIREYLVQAGSLEAALTGVLDELESQLSQAEEALASAKAQVLMGEEAVKKAEHELQHQLELLWYNMGQLEDEAIELEENKSRLDQETGDLERRLVTVDEKKEIEQKCRSARIVLMQEADISSAVNAGNDLVESTRAYIQNGRETAQHHRMLLYAINILAVVGGLLGMLSIPGSFEKARHRLWLVLPTVLCLICALVAGGLNVHLGLGQMYTALAAALAATLHLATILPKNKTIVLG